MQVLLTGTDGLWLIHATTVGAAIALCLFIITYLLGDSLPLRTVSTVNTVQLDVKLDHRFFINNAGLLISGVS